MLPHNLLSLRLNLLELRREDCLGLGELGFRNLHEPRNRSLKNLLNASRIVQTLLQGCNLRIPVVYLFQSMKFRQRDAAMEALQRMLGACYALCRGALRLRVPLKLQSLRDRICAECKLKHRCSLFWANVPAGVDVALDELLVKDMQAYPGRRPRCSVERDRDILTARPEEELH